jgi:glycosyltransferase involved in cell wall biosynthesis
MANTQKWFTCTPVRFVGDHTFFARDSGLLCKGFQEIGIDCKAIMPGPAMDNDQVEDLIRTDYTNLEDPEWWRSLDGNGVVFYGWGLGKYRKIAKAIKDAEMILVTHMDTAGIISVFNGIEEFSGNLWRSTMGQSKSLIVGFLKFTARYANAVSVGLIRNDLGRMQHLKCADIIGAISPIALGRIKVVCNIYGGDELVSKVRLIPHPNASYMITSPDIAKERLMVAIGRWDDEKIKGTLLLKETCTILLENDADLEIEIYGPCPVSMNTWHQHLIPQIKERLHLKGLVPNIQLRLALQRAQVELCTSLTEGYHTVSAEALCCGCSVVGPDIPEIPSMKWFTDGLYGRIAERNPHALAEAVFSELKAWENNERSPNQISEHWTKILHAPNVTKRILDLVSSIN